MNYAIKILKAEATSLRMEKKRIEAVLEMEAYEDETKEAIALLDSNINLCQKAILRMETELNYNNKEFLIS